MTTISKFEQGLPPGYRFQPTDAELIVSYLGPWVFRGAYHCPKLEVVNINNCEPWELPVTALVGGNMWYFFCSRSVKYGKGNRKDQSTKEGFWKATGKDREVMYKGQKVGARKTLVFYMGRAPNGNKTNYVMHEYHILTPHQLESFSKDEWVLCRVFNKGKESNPPVERENSHQFVAPSTPLEIPYVNFQPNLPVPCFPDMPQISFQPPPLVDALEYLETLTDRQCPNSYISDPFSPDSGAANENERCGEKGCNHQEVAPPPLSTMGREDLRSYLTGPSWDQFDPSD